jgi:hypothetical protein
MGAGWETVLRPELRRAPPLQEKSSVITMDGRDHGTSVRAARARHSRSTFATT